MEVRIGCAAVAQGGRHEVVYAVEVFSNGKWRVVEERPRNMRLIYKCPIAAIRMAARLREVLA